MPAYNLEDKILLSIIAVRELLHQITEDYQIIVVDDGSTDATYVRASLALDDRVVVLRNPSNKGKGFSVKEGVGIARGNYVIMMDADRDLDYNELKRYVSLLKENDIIIASKRHPDAVYQAPWSRKFLGLAFSALVRLLTGVNHADTQTGMKAFKGEVLKKVMKSVLVKRYAFDVEMLTVAKLMKLKVAEVPVNVAQGRHFNVDDALYMLVDLLGITYRLRIVKWYQKSLVRTSPEYAPLIRI
jgi:glycosyltransferase involved in cell wall biosynthesis